ncbi:hypothetical protein MRX96_051061, partial [Rhipicephalus microplus]
LGRGLLLSENPHLRARFQIVHRRRDERRKVLAWRGRALSGYRLPSDDLGRGLLLSENPHLRARFQIVHRRRDERRKVLAWRGRAPVWLPATERRFVHSALNPLLLLCRFHTEHLPDDDYVITGTQPAHSLLVPKHRHGALELFFSLPDESDTSEDEAESSDDEFVPELAPGDSSGDEDEPGPSTGKRKRRRQRTSINRKRASQDSMEPDVEADAAE